MQAVTTRYNGTFVPPGAVAPLPRVRHWEIWNEPNIVQFFRFNGKSSLPKYKALIKAAYPRIKAANPASVVIAGVAGPRSSTGGGNIGSRPWMNSILGDKSLKFDAYSQHIYPSQGPHVHVQGLRQGLPHLEQPAGDLRRPQQEARRA